jgi:RNA polymerase primary sigma factor
MTTATIQRTDDVNKVNVHAGLLRERVLSILSREIDFIPNPEFATCARSNDPIVTAIIDSSNQGTAPVELPTHLRGFCETKLLTHEQEAALFREMNFAKYRADEAREWLDSDCHDQEAVQAIEALLERAQAIRDHLVKANTRLVISTVKKFVTPQQSFDDLLSEGTLTLMHAVEKFDYDRGFRFSTYAYRSIARSAYRAVSDARKDESRYRRDAEDWAFEQEETQASSTATEQTWSNLRDLTKTMLAKLDPRERLIIRSRYALGAHRKVRTFQDLANRLGVSKERVRQLERRAVSKLSAMAAEFDMDDLFAASMV